MLVQSSNFSGNGMFRCGFKDGIYRFPPHIHQFSEIVYACGGEVTLTVDGACHTLRAGEIAVIAPFRVHGFYSETTCRLWLSVHSDALLTGFMTEDEIYRGRSACIFTPSASLRTYLDGHLIDSREELVHTDPPRCRRMQALLHAIYDEYTDVVPADDAGGKTPMLSEILLYMSAHYREPITLSTVAAALGYAPGYLSHCLPALGMNFCSLLNSFRVEYAKNLLLTKRFRMIDIALESGFSGERSFHRAFHRVTGRTPCEYRAHRENGTAAGLPTPDFFLRDAEKSD